MNMHQNQNRDGTVLVAAQFYDHEPKKGCALVK